MAAGGRLCCAGAALGAQQAWARLAARVRLQPPPQLLALVPPQGLALALVVLRAAPPAPKRPARAAVYSTG